MPPRKWSHRRPPYPAPMPGLAAVLAEAGIAGTCVATVSSTLDPESDAAFGHSGLLYIPSIRDAVTALAKVSGWMPRRTSKNLLPSMRRLAFGWTQSARQTTSFTGSN